MSAPGFGGWMQPPAAYGEDPFTAEDPSETATQAITHAPVKDRRNGYYQPAPSMQYMQYPYNNNVFYNEYSLASQTVPKLDPAFNYSAAAAAAARPQRVLAAAAHDTGGDGLYAGAESSSTAPTSYGGTTIATSSPWGGGPPRTTQRRNGKDKESIGGVDESSTRPNGLLWACPFLIPVMMEGGHCPDACHGFSRIGDVRQHIDRRHRQPPHCPSCGSIFTARHISQLQAHINQRRCIQVPFDVPGVTDDQFDQIRDRARATPPHTVTDVERWFQIWEVLFPDTQRPLSPFMNGSVFAMRSRASVDRYLYAENRGWAQISALFPMQTGNPEFLRGLHELIENTMGDYVEFVGEQDDRTNDNNRAAPP